MITKEQRAELRVAYGAGGYMRKKLSDGSVVDVLKSLFDALDALDALRDKYIADLEREIGYPHWTEGQRYGLVKALKWAKETL